MSISREKVTNQTLKGYLIKGVLGVGGLKVLDIMLSMLLVVVLARSLGSDEYGIYVFCMAVVSLLAIPAQAGLPNLIVREIARYQLNEEWGKLRGMVYASNFFVFFICAVITLLVLIGCYVVKGTVNDKLVSTMMWGVLLVPLVALGNIRGAVLCGLRRVVLGQVPELLVRPVLFLVFLGLALFVGDLSSENSIALHVFSAFVAFLVGVFFVVKYFPEEAKNVEKTYELSRWKSSLIPFSIVAGLQVINNNADIIMLGLLSESSQVSSYKISIQIASLLTLTLTIINMVAAPYMARLYEASEIKSLQKLVSFGTRAAFFTSLPIMLIIIIYGEYIINFLFGDGYDGVYWPLLIVGFGQLVNVAFGPVGYLLAMTGYERFLARGYLISVSINLVLNLIFIPLFGVVGAAVTTAITTIVINYIFFRYVKENIKINCCIV